MHFVNRLHKGIVSLFLLISLISYSDTSGSSQSNFHNKIELLVERPTQSSSIYYYNNGFVNCQLITFLNQYVIFNSTCFLNKLNFDFNLQFKFQKAKELIIHSNDLPKRALLYHHSLDDSESDFIV